MHVRKTYPEVAVVERRGRVDIRAVEGVRVARDDPTVPRREGDAAEDVAARAVQLGDGHVARRVDRNVLSTETKPSALLCVHVQTEASEVLRASETIVVSSDVEATCVRTALLLATT